MVAGIIGVDAIISTEVPVVTVDWLTGPSAGVTRLLCRTADRGMRAGIIGVDAIRSTKVPVVTVWRRWRLTCPSIRITRLPRRTDFLRIHTGMGDRIDDVNSTEVTIITACWL